MKKLALLFPGQGSQHIGMGKEMCKYFPVANKTFEEASDILKIDLKKLCFAGDINDLTRTENAQPALLTLSVAKYRIYRQELDITPALSAGHSLGEYSALTCAGAISFADAVKIVRKRGEVMQEASKKNSGSMMAVSGLNRKIVDEECETFSRSNNGVVVVANYNSAAQQVISGHEETLEKMGKILSARGAKVVPLKVSAAFHSPLMENAAEEFAAEFDKYSFKMPGWPVIANYNALPYKDKESIPLLLKQQIVSPIQWQSTMEYITTRGIDVAVELGPKKVLKNLLKKSCPNIKVYSTNTEEDLHLLYEIVPDDFVDKRPTLLERCLANAVAVPNRNFNEQEYKAGVIEPIRKIKTMYYQAAAEKREPGEREKKEAVALLRLVFDTKKVPQKEQTRRFKKLFKETGNKYKGLNYEL